MKRCIVLLAACLVLLCGCQRDRYFTPTRWVSDPDNRLQIVDDLLDNYELVGMTEAEILNLLGKNDNRSGYFVEDNRFVYRLGIDTYDIDNSWLLIDFENGVVTEYSITTD